MLAGSTRTRTRITRPRWTSAGRCSRRRASRRRTSGYRELLDWLSGHGEIDVVAVESTGSYAAALVRYLREHGMRVVEVDQPHAHTRRRVGKSDPINAEMAARLFQAGKARAVPKQTDGIVESIRLLRVARHSAVKSRSAALVQVRDLIITAPQELRDQLSSRKTLRGKVTVCARFRPSGRELRSPSQAAKFALRSTAQRIEALEIMRCLKRYIAREVYNSLRADLAETQPQPRPAVATTIMCGPPGFGINRTRT